MLLKPKLMSSFNRAKDFNKVTKCKAHTWMFEALFYKLISNSSNCSKRTEDHPNNSPFCLNGWNWYKYRIPNYYMLTFKINILWHLRQPECNYVVNLWYCILNRSIGGIKIFLEAQNTLSEFLVETICWFANIGNMIWQIGLQMSIFIVMLEHSTSKKYYLNFVG